MERGAGRLNANLAPASVAGGVPAASARRSPLLWGLVPMYVVQLLLFLSPVAYQLSAVPSDALWLYKLNPLAGLLEGWRWAILGTTAPSMALVAYSVGVSLAFFVVGLVVFT